VSHHDAIIPATRRTHLWQVDLVRIAPMLGMATTHVVLYSVRPDSAVGGAALTFLHVSREIFLFVSAFVLFTAEQWDRGVRAVPFWRRRVPLIVIPYLLWTLIYWPLSGDAAGLSLPAFTRLGIDLATGWFHLYFLLLTLQLYLALPALAWLLRRTRGHHIAVLVASAALQIAVTWAMQYQWEELPGSVSLWLQGAQNELTSYQLYVVGGALAAIHLPRLLGWLRAHTRAAVGLAAGAVAGGEAAYALNLALGQSPAVASNVFQPAMVPLVLGSIVGLWMLAERWLTRYPLDGALWGSLRRTADGSFGFYLAHMVPLLLLTRPPVLNVLPTDHLPPLQASAARLAMVVAATAGLVWVIRRTPLSRALTGRPGAGVRAAPRPAASPAPPGAGSRCA
jgi:hypothetical protein